MPVVGLSNGPQFRPPDRLPILTPRSHRVLRCELLYLWSFQASAAGGNANARVGAARRVVGSATDAAAHPHSLVEAEIDSLRLAGVVREAMVLRSLQGIAMMKRAAFIALMIVLSPTIALAGENMVLGTWKLKAMFREVTATGEKFNQMGEHPNGYLSYSPDGRMYAIVTTDNRTKPSDVNPTPDERAKLHQSLVAYAGTYTVQGDKVIHRVDISWNEAWTGTEQIRFFKLDGNLLTITTAVQQSPIDGREGRSVLVWEKVKAPAQ
jgi:Lipocalin-like domain